MKGNAPDDWLTLGLLLAGLIAVLVVPVVLAALFEKRLVWPYLPPEEPDQAGPGGVGDEANPYAVGRAVSNPAVPPPTPYSATAVGAAESLGFAFLGAFRDGKGRLYRIRYEIGLSPDREVLAIIGAGSVGAMPVQATWLITPLVDGRRVTTLDNQSASEIDLAGLTDEALVSTPDFRKLLDRHRERLTGAASAPVPYPMGDPLGEHRAFRARRVERLEGLGHATHLDPLQATWRYTLKGALAFAVRAYLNGFRRVVLPDSLLVRWRPAIRREGT